MPPLKRAARTCKVCMERPAIYRCPQCQMETCSAQCTGEHKDQDKCAGSAPEVADRPLRDMNDDDMARDFRFLEKVGRAIECSARYDAAVSSEKFGLTTPGMATKSKHGNASFKAIRQKAEEARVILKMVPPRFQRRRENTTCLSNSKNNRKIRWRCQYENHLGVSVQSKFDKAVSHDTILRQLVEPQLPSGCTIDNVAVLMEDFSQPVNVRGYLLLDLDYRLKDSLADCVVIEFPTFYLVKRGELRQFDAAVSEISSSGDESEGGQGPLGGGESELSSSPMGSLQSLPRDPKDLPQGNVQELVVSSLSPSSASPVTPKPEEVLSSSSSSSPVMLERGEVIDSDHLQKHSGVIVMEKAAQYGATEKCPPQVTPSHSGDKEVEASHQQQVKELQQVADSVNESTGPSANLPSADADAMQGPVMTEEVVNHPPALTDDLTRLSCSTSPVKVGSGVPSPITSRSSSDDEKQTAAEGEGESEIETSDDEDDDEVEVLETITERTKDRQAVTHLASTPLSQTISAPTPPSSSASPTPPPELGTKGNFSIRGECVGRWRSRPVYLKVYRDALPAPPPTLPAAAAEVTSD